MTYQLIAWTEQWHYLLGVFDDDVSARRFAEQVTLEGNGRQVLWKKEAPDLWIGEPEDGELIVYKGLSIISWSIALLVPEDME